MPKAKTDKIMFYGTGRRKSSIARVRLVEGKGTSRRQRNNYYKWKKYRRISRNRYIKSYC